MKYLIAIFFIFSVVIAGLVEETGDRIQILMGKSVIIEHQIIQIPDSIQSVISNIVKQNCFRDELHIWHITQGDSLTAIAILDNVVGKSMPITFFVIFTAQSQIQHVEIVKYRESYGGEIKSRRWLDQFIEKDASSDFLIGKDINGISGATISANSISHGVNKLTILTPWLMEVFKKMGK
jgi:Na+-translocating ferredoxin:NAD+ oxidoreductase RnfG subunit